MVFDQTDACTVIYIIPYAVADAVAQDVAQVVTKCVAQAVAFTIAWGPFKNYVIPLRWVGGHKNIIIANSIKQICSEIVAKT